MTMTKVLSRFLLFGAVHFDCIVGAHAWGEIGHEIVANIAWTRLDDDPQLQMHLRKILNVTVTVTTTNTTKSITNAGKHDNNSNSDEDDGSPLANVANWADHVRHFLPWSGPLHFIDIQDEVIDGGCHYHPHFDVVSHDDDDDNRRACMFHYERDCVENGCVAGAILNYSSQLLPAQDAVVENEEEMEGNEIQHEIERCRRLSLRGAFDTIRNSNNLKMVDPYHQKQALMFLIHFIGDIHQPLHVSRQTDRGGNDIKVHYHLVEEGVLHDDDARRRFAIRDHRRDDTNSAQVHQNHHHATMNLHSVWDTAMIETSLHRSHYGNRTIMENHLLALLQDHPKWEDHYLNGPNCSVHDGYGLNRSCVVSWGQESWKMALRFAYTDVDEVTDILDGDTISEEYYESRLPIVEERLVAGGVRLAATLKAIFWPGGREIRQEYKMK